MPDKNHEDKNAPELNEVQKLELEIKREELAALKLQKQEREYSIKDLRQRLGERDIKEQQHREDREAQGRTFAQQKATDELRWGICTHKKGGTASPRDMRVLTTGGTGQYYSVMKHQMINGDIWVRCTRCGRTWKPPLKEQFYFDVTGRQVPSHMGKLNIEKYEKTYLEYHQAVAFETNNTNSTSVLCRFSKWNDEIKKWVDATDDYRELVADSNLR